MLQALHESVDLGLRSLAYSDLHGLECLSANLMNILFQFMLSSYIADISNCTGMLPFNLVPKFFCLHIWLLGLTEYSTKKAA